MAWTAEWRTKGDRDDAVFILDNDGAVREAFPATQSLLSRFLTRTADLAAWKAESSLAGDKSSPEAWGELVIARDSSGEVIEVEPELYWHGIYQWFRSWGVDYDTPGPEGSSPPKVMPRLPRSSLMDD